MENKVVFSIFVDIPDDRLDNPGWYVDGVQVKTEKSKDTKIALLDSADKIAERQMKYAHDIGGDYQLFKYDNNYQEFFDYIKKHHPEISEYDIINFYKHRVMRNLAEEYNYVCYMDFDVVPNTTDCIFEALLMDEGIDPENDVFNTGIMAGSSEVIKRLDYFRDFEDVINKMTNLKQDDFSMYPKNIQRVFGYDNETVFSYWVKLRQIEIQYMSRQWHWLVDELITKPQELDPEAKLYHFINKQMTWAL